MVVVAVVIVVVLEVVIVVGVVVVVGYRCWHSGGGGSGDSLCNCGSFNSCRPLLW